MATATAEARTEARTRDQRRGAELVQTMKDHLVHVLDKAETERGQNLTSVKLEVAAGLELGLKQFNNYLTYSMLQALIDEGRVVAIQEEGHRTKYALSDADEVHDQRARRGLRAVA